MCPYAGTAARADPAGPVPCSNRTARIREAGAPPAVGPYRPHFTARLLSWTGPAVTPIGLAFEILGIGGGPGVLRGGPRGERRTAAAARRRGRRGPAVQGPGHGVVQRGLCAREAAVLLLVSGTVRVCRPSAGQREPSSLWRPGVSSRRWFRPGFGTRPTLC